MEQLTREDYRKIVGCISTVRNCALTQPFPKDMEEGLRKQVEAFIAQKAAEMQALIDKVSRIHLD